MRTGTRNWILALLAAGFIVFFVGRGSSQTPEAVQAADTRTAMERYVDAFSQYTQAELDRFQRYQSAVAQSDWDNFWGMLIRVVLCIAVLLAGYFGLRSAHIRLEWMSNKASIVPTPYGNYLVDRDDSGKKVFRPMDKPFEESPSKPKITETLPVYHNGQEQIIEFKDGRVIDVVDDAEDFLKKAIKASKANSNELPRHESMGVSAEKWSSMVHEVLGGLFTVENRGGGVRTYCSAYPDLATTYFAIKNKEVPLPEKKKAKK